MKAHLLEWAEAGGIDPGKLETRHGKLSWVLKEEHKRSNLYSEEWWRHIETKEHRWARALNSSQCFAVNLFAPLAEEPALAQSVLQRFAPDLIHAADDSITVQFEYTPKGAPGWLGEKGQATQVDVAFEVWCGDRLRAALLVEVKFTEADFGSCRGFPAAPGKPSANPNPSRCLSVGPIRDDPEKYCWLAEHEGRTYWQLLRKESSSIVVGRLADNEPCPFRGSLYQIMRNAVLADEITRQHNLDWSWFALCVHPGNEGVWTFSEPVAGATDARAALSSLMARELLLFDPRPIVEATEEASPAYREWADYMKCRYKL